MNAAARRPSLPRALLRALVLANAGLAVALAMGCGAPSAAVAPGADRGAPPPADGARDAVPAAAPVDPGPSYDEAAIAAAGLSSDASVADNVARVEETVRRFRAINSPAVRPPGAPPPADEREVFAAMDAARRALADLYRSARLEPDEHALLCQTLSRLHEDLFADAAAHCRAYLASDPQAGTRQHEQALSTLGSVAFRLDDLDEVRRVSTAYRNAYCGADAAATAAGVDAGLRRAFCKRALTFYLPHVAHRQGKVADLEALLADCAASGFTDARDLEVLRSLLLADLWQREDTRDVAAMAREVLDLPAWKGTSEPNRELISQALCAQSRLRLIAGDIYGARRVYLDYAWNHPATETTWRRVRLDAPGALLAGPAPALPEAPAAAWFGGRPPRQLPGAAALERPILLHCFSPNPALLSDHIPGMLRLAGAAGDRVDIVGLVPRSTQSVDVEARAILDSLDAAAFDEATERFVEATRIPYPVRILEKAEIDALRATYRVERFPTLILIDRRGRIAAYAPMTHIEPVDIGWLRCIAAAGGEG